MLEADRSAFYDLLGGVFDYYRTELSATVLEIYWTGLRQFDLDAVRTALGQHTMNPDTGQFIPKLADVVKMMGGSTLDSALVGWSKVERAVSGAGAYQSVAFDDPIIHRVVEDMGGWPLLCGTTARDWPFKQNEFTARYRGYKMRGQVPAYPPRLIGIVEGDNASRGFRGRDETFYIGDPTKAALVVSGGTVTPRLGMALAVDALPGIPKKLEAP